jgi:hypothetical protein
VAAHTRQAFDHLLHARRLQAELAQHSSRDAPLLANQTQQEVFCTYVIVVQTLGLFVRKTEHTASPLRKALHLIGHRSTSEP